MIGITPERVSVCRKGGVGRDRWQVSAPLVRVYLWVYQQMLFYETWCDRMRRSASVISTNCY